MHAVDARVAAVAVAHVAGVTRRQRDGGRHCKHGALKGIVTAPVRESEVIVGVDDGLAQGQKPHVSTASEAALRATVGRVSATERTDAGGGCVCVQASSCWAPMASMSRCPEVPSRECSNVIKRIDTADTIRRTRQNKSRSDGPRQQSALIVQPELVFANECKIGARTAMCTG